MKMKLLRIFLLMVCIFLFLQSNDTILNVKAYTEDKNCMSKSYKSIEGDRGGHIFRKALVCDPAGILTKEQRDSILEMEELQRLYDESSVFVYIRGENEKETYDNEQFAHYMSYHYAASDDYGIVFLIDIYENEVIILQETYTLKERIITEEVAADILSTTQHYLDEQRYYEYIQATIKEIDKTIQEAHYSKTLAGRLNPKGKITIVSIIAALVLSFCIAFRRNAALATKTRQINTENKNIAKPTVDYGSKMTFVKTHTEVRRK